MKLSLRHKQLLLKTGTVLGGYMNSLTKFLDLNFKNFTHTDSHLEVKIIESLDHAEYEVIENETLKGCDFRDLTVSGSLFSLTTFDHVSFEDCVFYGSKIENCTFIGCTFKNCKFEFSTVSHCNFNNCNFELTRWSYSTFKRNKLSFCQIDEMAYQFIDSTTNFFWETLPPTPSSWEVALASKQASSLNATEEERKPTSFFEELVQRFSKAA
tara:strand:- start:24927 stop:25562 length:636 start_codon:yes stop_codon:yes gene_type:complete